MSDDTRVPTDATSANRLLVVSAVAREFLEGKPARDVLKHAVEAVARCVPQVRVSCFLRDGEDTFRVVHSVSNTNFPSIEGFHARAPIATLQDFAQTFAVSDFARDPRQAVFAHAQASLGTRALVFAPLYREAKAYGALTLAAPTPRDWTADEVAIAHEVAQVLSLGLQQSRADDKRQRAEAELRAHRDTLQQVVEERTRHLVAAKEKAERADRSKSEFLVNLTHELRTPLHAILSFARLGRDKLGEPVVDRERMLQYCDRIIRSGESLQLLVSDLVSLSRLGTDSETAVHADESIVAMLDTAEWEMGEILRARAQTLARVVETQDLQVRCDRTHVVQALYHLLSNASKFAPTGSEISVTVRSVTLPPRASSTTPLPAVEIAVNDRGPGIAENELESIFEAFVKGSRGTHSSSGRGLGLTLCRQIARRHGGTIRAFNRQGGGAMFKLVLPRDPQATVPEDSVVHPEDETPS